MDDMTECPSLGAADDPDDYVFRFRLKENERSEQAGCADPLIEVVRGMLADLSSTIVFTHKGRRVQVDGFRLLQEPDRQYEIFPTPTAK